MLHHNLKRGLGVAGLCAGLMLGLAQPAFALPAYEQLRQQHQSSDFVLQDRHGQEVQVLRRDFQRRMGNWLTLPEVSPALQRAVLLSEDKRFEAHDGVDWYAMAGAGWDTLTGSQRRGASTISMQLAGIVDESLRQSAGGRSVWQKVRQISAAQELEDHWSKAHILEAYLNTVSFRGELIGVDAMARVLFQKQALALTVRESAIAAALLRGPNASVWQVQRRACALLRDMGQGGQCAGLDNFVPVVLGRQAGSAFGQIALAPHFARLFREQLKEQDQAVSSLDAKLQQFVQESVQRQLLALQQAHVQDAAVVVLANDTGEILAYVGSSQQLSQASQVDHARALRQAGSTLKPFIYAQALDERRLTAASLLQDSPLSLPTGNGLYVPQNYDKHFTGWVSARTALASSLNIPAIRVLMLLGAEPVVQRLQMLGLPLSESAQFYGYSLALGSADVTLLSLTNAYRSLATQGSWSPWQLQPASGPAAPVRELYSPQAAWLIGHILSDRQARVLTFGLDSLLSTRFWTAVKTGTSKDMRDNWAMGWSEHYTVGVWVGNSSGQSMQDVSGVSGAAPIWHEVMAYLHSDTASRPPEPPAGVQAQTVQYVPALEAERLEYFIQGTEQAQFQLIDQDADTGARLRIHKPVNGTIIALDPDIPAINQQLLLRAGGDATALGKAQWRINGHLYTQGAQGWWPLKPGRQTIEILDEQGAVQDQVQIEVRGASLKDVYKH